jgi:hypothetical protein
MRVSQPQWASLITSPRVSYINMGRGAEGGGGHDRSVFHIYRDWSRSGIKPCSPKKKIWDNPEKRGETGWRGGGG